MIFLLGFGIGVTLAIGLAIRYGHIYLDLRMEELIRRKEYTIVSMKHLNTTQTEELKQLINKAHNMSADYKNN
jgi:hypothetical protein